MRFTEQNHIFPYKSFDLLSKIIHFHTNHWFTKQNHTFVNKSFDLLNKTIHFPMTAMVNFRYNFLSKSLKYDLWLLWAISLYNSSSKSLKYDLWKLWAHLKMAWMVTKKYAWILCARTHWCSNCVQLLCWGRRFGWLLQ